jgi:uroporphyrinogen-III synthase
MATERLQRVLDHAGEVVASLRPAECSPLELQLVTTLACLIGAEIELERIEQERSELSDRLEARVALDRAKGILQRDLGISEEEAYLTIQRQSRQRRKTRKEIAEAIVLGDELRRPR